MVCGMQTENPLLRLAPGLGPVYSRGKAVQPMDARDVDNLSPQDWAKVRHVIDFILSHPKLECNAETAPAVVDSKEVRKKPSKAKRAENPYVQLALKLTDTIQ